MLLHLIQYYSMFSLYASDASIPYTSIAKALASVLISSIPYTSIVKSLCVTSVFLRYIFQLFPFRLI